MFHINDRQEYKPCKAKTPEACTFYVDENATNHFENEADAKVASEKLLEEKHGIVSRARKYSFRAQFEKIEEKFKADFNGFPNRFFNADLKGRLRLLGYAAYRDGADIDPKNYDPATMDPKFISPGLYRDLPARMFQAVSDPKDTLASDEEVEEAIMKLGADDVKTVHDLKDLQNADDDRAWVAHFGDQMLMITAAKRKAPFSMFRFRYSNRMSENWDQPNFTRVDVRTIMGAIRAENKTGVKVFQALASNGRDKNGEIGRAALLMHQRLEDAQLEGKNFTAQKRYIRENAKKIAGVFDEKKDTDDIRKEMMRTSSLNEHFRGLDLDNEVDPDELADFERCYEEVRTKLPKIPEDRKPKLFVKKLGKHRAIGLFSSSQNSLAVDVRTSAAFIHETGHYFDLVVKDNASLSSEFREIAKGYSANLKVPSTEPKSRWDYLTTSTEVWARNFECYCFERLGINNRLINPDRFSDYDYEPIMKNPELKEKAYALFDKLFKEE